MILNVLTEALFNDFNVGNSFVDVLMNLLPNFRVHSSGNAYQRVCMHRYQWKSNEKSWDPTASFLAILSLALAKALAFSLLDELIGICRHGKLKRFATFIYALHNV